MVTFTCRLLVPGWSRSTVATLEIYPDVAYVGSHLVGDNDIVTDAGGCVWNDGSPEIIGRWLTELQPDLSYMRPVDYSSAAAVATRKDVFLSVRGLDERVKGVIITCMSAVVITSLANDTSIVLK